MGDTVVIVRKSDMKPILECLESELNGRILKSEYIKISILEWLQGYNRAVKKADGVEPSIEQLKNEF